MARSQREDLDFMNPAAHEASLGTKLKQLQDWITGNRIVGGTPGLARGSTDTNIATGLIYFQIAKAFLTKAAVAAGTALGALGTTAADKWAVFLVVIDAAGTITVVPGAGNVAGYASESAALAAKPATPAGKVALGHFTIKTGVGLAWIAGTDALAGGTTGNEASTTNYYQAGADYQMPVELLT